MKKNSWLVIFVFVVINFGIYMVGFSTCPETKPQSTQCGNGGERNDDCVIGFVTCGNCTTKAECEGASEVVECEKNVQINEEDNAPEQTKTGVDTVAAQVDCYYYHECKWSRWYSTCSKQSEKSVHKVTPVKLIYCP
ncbi:MAG: hypothetical protein LBJ67_07075 [Planctomycetaceae bacterium]|jgi:hypothetical protein|nr:hypothetical protein [Planctomycetaceae bacterium]